MYERAVFVKAQDVYIASLEDTSKVGEEIHVSIILGLRLADLETMSNQSDAGERGTHRQSYTIRYNIQTSSISDSL